MASFLGPQFSGVSTFTSAGALATEVLYLGALGNLRTYTAQTAQASDVVYLGALELLARQYTAKGSVLFRIWGDCSLTSLWDQTEVVFGGSAYGHVYRPSLSLGCDHVFGHPAELVFGEGTPTAFCFAHPDISAIPGADIPVVGSAALRQGIQIIAHGLDFSALARCLVRGIETAEGQNVAPNAGVAACQAHPYVTAVPPTDWTDPGCLTGELPDPTTAVRNYVF